VSYIEMQLSLRIWRRVCASCATTMDMLPIATKTLDDVNHREIETLTREPTIVPIYMLKVYSQKGGAVADCPVMLAERKAQRRKTDRT
jgi:hypothetical protein